MVLGSLFVQNEGFGVGLRGPGAGLASIWADLAMGGYLELTKRGQNRVFEGQGGQTGWRGVEGVPGVRNRFGVHHPVDFDQKGSKSD